MQTVTERDLVIELAEARKTKEDAEKFLKEANLRVLKAEAALIEALNASGATSTAKYEGVGSFSKLQPRVYATYKKDDEATVFAFLRNVGREDLIRPSIHPQSLSALVKEHLETGKPLPEAIAYYSAEALRFNPKGA